MLAAVVIALFAGHPAAASAQSSKRIRYVASNVYTFAAALASDATGIAVQGNVEFVPATDRITVKLDDAVGRWTMPVVVLQSGRVVRFVCVRDRVATTVAGLRPGTPAYLWIMDATANERCQTGATTGTLLLGN